jgi:hypothetical protein
MEGNSMNSRERFLMTMKSGKPDRVPYFEEGIRRDVLRAWRRQGLASEMALMEMFATDRREEIDLDVEPHPHPREWPASISELKTFSRRLNPKDPFRLPFRWRDSIQRWKGRDHVLMMRLHQGFFLTMGVRGWNRFYDLMKLMHNDPAFVRAMMQFQGEFVAAFTDRLLNNVELDAAIFSEPIGDNHGSLISPKMYADFVLTSYRPILDVLHKHAVKVVIVRTYANVRQLIPVLLENGFDCLWACEVNTEKMDYLSLRKEFGNALKLIGGIDLDVLHQGRDAIRKEVEEKVPPLITQGGYIPLVDGRVRKDIPLEDYIFYRQLLEKVTTR